MRALPILLGALCGLLWWIVSMALGAKAYGVLGRAPEIGAVAGACTGIAVSWVSSAFYRRWSLRHLLWYSPLSVYGAIALYGLAIFSIRVALDDFHPDQIRWAVGLQNVLGMWWGVTLFLPVALPVHLLAYANHRLLRRVVVGA